MQLYNIVIKFCYSFFVFVCLLIVLFYILSTVRAGAAHHKVASFFKNKNYVKNKTGICSFHFTNFSGLQT